MADFSQYGGPSDEWLAFEASMPKPAGRSKQSLEELVEATNREREQVSAEQMKAYLPDLLLSDHTVTSRDDHPLRVRIYTPKSSDRTQNAALILHLHGGGHLFGSLSSEDAACARLALSTRQVIVNLEYRHTPRYTYPTAWNDVEDTLNWLHKARPCDFDPDRVILEGISAGAWMTASLVLSQSRGALLQSVPPVAGQILMIPCVAHPECYEPQLARLAHPQVSSKVQNKHAPILPVERVNLFIGLLKASANPSDLFLNPGNATPEQATRLPPTVLGIAGYDPLRDEGLLYGETLKEAGVPTDVHLFKGVPHGFRRFGDKLSLSERWDGVISDGIKWILSEPKNSNTFTVED